MDKPLIFEARDLETLAALVGEKLAGMNGDTVSALERKNVVRVAVTLQNHGVTQGRRRLEVLRSAPAWVYQYLSKGIIALPGAAKPARAPKRARKAKVTS